MNCELWYHLHLLFVNMCNHYVIHHVGFVLKTPLVSTAHFWLRGEDMTAGHMSRPISSHNVLGFPYVPQILRTFGFSQDMSGTCPGHVHLRYHTTFSKSIDFTERTANLLQAWVKSPSAPQNCHSTGKACVIFSRQTSDFKFHNQVWHVWILNSEAIDFIDHWSLIIQRNV
jgi:hypothetical protein